MKTYKTLCVALVGAVSLLLIGTADAQLLRRRGDVNVNVGAGAGDTAVQVRDRGLLRGPAVSVSTGDGAAQLRTGYHNTYVQHQLLVPRRPQRVQTLNQLNTFTGYTNQPANIVFRDQGVQYQSYNQNRIIQRTPTSRQLLVETSDPPCETTQTQTTQTQGDAQYLTQPRAQVQVQPQIQYQTEPQVQVQVQRQTAPLYQSERTIERVTVAEHCAPQALRQFSTAAPQRVVLASTDRHYYTARNEVRHGRQLNRHERRQAQRQSQRPANRQTNIHVH